MLTQMITETLLGALTGYVTNHTAIRSLFQPGGVIAVSYTHLDVYKRQVEYGLIDEVGSIHEAMHKLNALINEREAACHD